MLAPGEATWSYVLSATFVVLGAALLRREQRRFQVHDGYNHLPPDLYRYHRRQFWRRTLTSTLILLLGLALVAAVHYIDEGRRPRLFAAFWVTILSLVLCIVTLACLDLIAIRQYASRERRRLFRERLSLPRRPAVEFRPQGDPPPEGWTPECN
jgi:peptidoglycan/LPS O-acetylase OafA/YrhL